MESLTLKDPKCEVVGWHDAITLEGKGSLLGDGREKDRRWIGDEPRGWLDGWLGW